MSFGVTLDRAGWFIFVIMSLPVSLSSLSRAKKLRAGDVGPLAGNCPEKTDASRSYAQLDLASGALSLTSGGHWPREPKQASSAPYTRIDFLVFLRAPAHK